MDNPTVQKIMEKMEIFGGFVRMILRLLEKISHNG